MTTLIRIDESQYPGQVMADLKNCFRHRAVNHKFHYDSAKQTQRWLALHQAYSPSRTDADCARTYELAFGEAAQRIPPGPMLLTGLGCGGGQKDRRLVQELQTSGHQVDYLATDVSTAMVLCGCQEVAKAQPAALLTPVVWDLARVPSLADVLEEAAQGPAGSNRKPRLLSFFGMIPNFEPEEILPKLSEAVRAGDWLLFSSNLAPGEDYRAGVERITPLYDNELTREWLIQFLLDAGVERSHGEIHFAIEPMRPVWGCCASRPRFGLPGTGLSKLMESPSHLSRGNVSGCFIRIAIHLCWWSACCTRMGCRWKTPGSPVLVKRAFSS